jgi:hypothetical protein
MGIPADWYERQRAGLGDEFIDEPADAYARIREAPRRYGRVEGFRFRQIHQFKLHRFPYLLIDELTAERFVVLATAHAHRRAGYWDRRRG